MDDHGMGGGAPPPLPPLHDEGGDTIEVLPRVRDGEFHLAYDVDLDMAGWDGPAAAPAPPPLFHPPPPSPGLPLASPAAPVGLDSIDLLGQFCASGGSPSSSSGPLSPPRSDGGSSVSSGLSSGPPLGAPAGAPPSPLAAAAAAQAAQAAQAAPAFAGPRNPHVILHRPAGRLPMAAAPRPDVVTIARRSDALPALSLAFVAGHEVAPNSAAAGSCAQCYAAHVRCGGGRPCERCARTGLPCQARMSRPWKCARCVAMGGACDGARPCSSCISSGHGAQCETTARLLCTNLGPQALPVTPLTVEGTRSEASVRQALSAMEPLIHAVRSVPSQLLDRRRIAYVQNMALSELAQHRECSHLQMLEFAKRVQGATRLRVRLAVLRGPVTRMTDSDVRRYLPMLQRSDSVISESVLREQPSFLLLNESAEQLLPPDVDSQWPAGDSDSLDGPDTDVLMRRLMANAIHGRTQLFINGRAMELTNLRDEDLCKVNANCSLSTRMAPWIETPSSTYNFFEAVKCQALDGPDAMVNLMVGSMLEGANTLEGPALMGRFGCSDPPRVVHGRITVLRSPAGLCAGFFWTLTDVSQHEAWRAAQASAGAGLQQQQRQRQQRQPAAAAAAAAAGLQQQQQQPQQQPPPHHASFGGPPLAQMQQS